MSDWETHYNSKVVQEKVNNDLNDNPLRLEVRIGVHNRRNFRVNEIVHIQFIIKNISSKSIEVIEINNALPYGFKLLKSDLPFSGKILKINQTLAPECLTQIYVKAKAVHPVYKFKYVAEILWKDLLDYKIKTSNFTICKYSIFEEYSTIPAKEMRESTKRILSYRETRSTALKYIKKLGIKEISIKNFLDNTLPFYFSFITYDLKESKDYVLAEQNVLQDAIEYIKKRETPNLTFIIGPSFIGKTTFAANLLCYNLKTKRDEIFIFSLKGKREHLLDLIDSEIRNETNFSSLGEMLSSEIKLNKKRVEIWLDADHYMNSEANYEIISFLNKGFIKSILEKKQLYIFVIMNEKMFYDIASEINTPYNLIVLHTYTNDMAIDIAKVQIGDDKNKNDLLANILAHDKQEIFLKPPFLSYLLKTINAFASGAISFSSNRYIKERLIIMAIDLFRKDNLDHIDLPNSNWIAELSDELFIKDSKNKDPEFLREVKITAIDLETNYVLPREIDNIARTKLNLENTKILFIGGESGTGKTVLALKLGYELWKQGMYVFFVDIGGIREEEILPVMEVLKNICYDFVIILDNAHLDTERDILMQFYKVNPLKMIVTERSPKEETIVGKLLNYYVKKKETVGISKKPKLKLGELVFKKMVDEVIFKTLDFQRFVRDSIQFVIKNNLVSIPSTINIKLLTQELIRKTKETIILIRFIFRYYMVHKNKITLNYHTLSELSLRKVIEDYVSVLIEDIKSELEKEDKPSRYAYLVEPILVYLSLFSKYEISISDTFIKRRLIDIFNFNDGIEIILNKLAKKKEISQRLVDSFSINSFYIIPHASLAYNFWKYLSYKYKYKLNQMDEYAYLLLDKSADIGNILLKLYKYSENNEFCTNIIIKLAELLKDETLKSQFMEKMEKFTTLHSVFQFLWSLERIHRELFIKIINNRIYFEKLFSLNKMTKEYLKDALLILYIFQETPQFDRDLYKQFVEIIKKIIKKCDTTTLSIYEILLTVNSDILNEEELEDFLGSFFNNVLRNKDILLETQESLLSMPLSQLRKTLESLYFISRESNTLLPLYYAFLNKLFLSNEMLIEMLSKESTQKQINFIFFLKNRLKMDSLSKKLLSDLTKKKSITLKNLEFNILGELLGKIASIDNDLGLSYFKKDVNNILKKMTTLKRLVEFLDRIYRYDKMFGNKVSENESVRQHALKLLMLITFGELQSIIDDPSLSLSTKKFIFNLLVIKKDFIINLFKVQKLDDVIFLLETFIIIKDQWLSDKFYRKIAEEILYSTVDMIFSRLKEGGKIKSAVSCIMLLQILKIYGKNLNFKALMDLCKQYNAIDLLNNAYSFIKSEKMVKKNIERKFFLLMNTLFNKT